jgi:hypothetical protein
MKKWGQYFFASPRSLGKVGKPRLATWRNMCKMCVGRSGVSWADWANETWAKADAEIRDPTRNQTRLRGRRRLREGGARIAIFLR